MTVGNQSGMAGGSVPLNGESIIKQQSSATDVLTIQFASGTPSGSSAGRGLVVRTYVEDETTATGYEVFSVDYAGNVVAKGGLTLGTSAMLQIAGTPASSMGNSAATATGDWASTTITLSASHAGRLLIIPLSSAAGGTITLPKASGVTLGTTYKLYFAGAAETSGIKVSSTLSASNDVHLPSGSTGKTFQVTATGLQIGSYLEVVKVASKRWLGLPGGSTAAAWCATAVG